LVPQRILGLDYFRDLPARFPQALFPKVAVDGQIKNRALTLAAQINERFPEGQINIIAHSMGGLDARYLLSSNLLGLAPRVASLSTVSTPHRGTAIADLLLGLLPGIDSTSVRRVLDRFPAVQSGALDCLTTTFAIRFNQETPNVSSVRYLSYFGCGDISLALHPTHDFIASRAHTEEERANDGVVPMASAVWPSELVEPAWPADHLAQIGHNLDTLDLRSTFDHKSAFDRVVQRAIGAVASSD